MSRGIRVEARGWTIVLALLGLWLAACGGTIDSGDSDGGGDTAWGYVRIENDIMSHESIVRTAWRVSGTTDWPGVNTTEILAGDWLGFGIPVGPHDFLFTWKSGAKATYSNVAINEGSTTTIVVLKP